MQLCFGMCLGISGCVATVDLGAARNSSDKARKAGSGRSLIRCRMRWLHHSSCQCITPPLLLLVLAAARLYSFL